MKNEYDLGIHEVYDLFYHKKEMEDVDFYVEQAEKVDGPVLEVACGTGRIYLEALEKGVEIEGIDLSEGMLEKLREKAAERDLDPKVKKADMRSFEMDKKYDSIIIPFRSFLHNTKIEDQIKTLETCKEHLKSRGKLILNFFSLDWDYIRENYGRNERSFVKDGHDYKIIKDLEVCDNINMLNRTKIKVYRDGKKIYSGEYRLAFITKPHFELLLEKIGFSGWNVYGGFELEELKSKEQEQVWIVEK